MNIYTIPVPKQTLIQMPENEREFFLLAGHLANELTILNKLFMSTTQGLPPDKIRKRAAVVQALFIGKLFVGKLNEGWGLLQKRYFDTALSKDYDSHLDEEALEALRRLKQYFSRGNIIRKVRSGYVFHYPTEPLGLALNDLPDGDEFEIYLSDQNTNSLYYISESVINNAMLRDINSSDLQSAYERLINDTADVYRWFVEFIGGCMSVATACHLGSEINALITETTELEEAPRLEDLRIPFFVDTSAFRSE